LNFESLFTLNLFDTSVHSIQKNAYLRKPTGKKKNVAVNEINEMSGSRVIPAIIYRTFQSNTFNTPYFKRISSIEMKSISIAGTNHRYSGVGRR
jgi:hypothetical protein